MGSEMCIRDSWRGPPDWPEAVSYWSRADIILLPPDAAQLEGAKAPELATMTHYGYLLHPLGWRTVFEALHGRVTRRERLETT